MPYPAGIAHKPCVCIATRMGAHELYVYRLPYTRRDPVIVRDCGRPPALEAAIYCLSESRISPSISHSSIIPILPLTSTSTSTRTLWRNPMPEESSCTPEGGLEALAEVLFTHHRLEIPCEGEGKHAPLTKDKAGRKDLNGRLYRYWTCNSCRPRTKRNCRSYINEAERVLGREVVSELASTLLDERRAEGRTYDLLDSWLRGKLTPTSVCASSRNLKKRKPDSFDREPASKRSREGSDSDVTTVAAIVAAPTLSTSDALRAIYAIREDIDRLIEGLASAEQPPQSLAAPCESDGDEFVASPTPPCREPLRALAPNVISPLGSSDFSSKPSFQSPSYPSASVLQSLVHRFQQASAPGERNAARKEAKRLGLAAKFEAERSKRSKPPSIPNPSAA